MDHQQNQAEWVYHHRDQLSDERYKDLLAKNKDLEQQIKALEEKKIAKDPNYAPTGVDKDLMYSDDYAKQVQSDKDQEDADDTRWIWLLSIVFVPVVIGVSGWIGYQVFFKKRSF